MRKYKLAPKVLARIKWWDNRDGNGIAQELNGSEFYIDESVIGNLILRDGDFIFLRENLSIKHCRCGMAVTRAKVTEATKSEFQIASTIRNSIAYMQSATKQLIRLRRLRLGEV